MVDFNLEIQIRISWISSLPFEKDLQNCPRQERSFYANYACACKTAVLMDSQFEIPFLISQSNGKKEIQNRFLSVKIRFWISRSIANPKSKSRFPNRTHPKYWTTRHFPFQHLGNENNLCPTSTGCKKRGRNKLHLTAIKRRRQFIKSAMIEFFGGGRTCQRVIN